MKKSRYFFGSTIVLSVLLFLSGCKKHISSPVNDETAGAEQVSAQTLSDCKPSGLSVFADNRWINLIQRWYDAKGRLSYLKAYLSHDPINYTTLPFQLDWGELVYTGNEVILRDVPRDRIVMRVELDAFHRPTHSYFTPSADELDSTYYFYDGERLDFMHNNHYERRSDGSTAIVRQGYSFLYDSHGNISRIKGDDEPGSYRAHFTYNYGQPITGIMTPYHLNFPFRLLEAMELIRLPISHMPVQTIAGPYLPGSHYPNETYPVHEWNYNNPVITDGLVYSYSSYNKTFYTGWECGSTPQNRAGNSKIGITGIEHFRQLYPQAFK